MNYQLIIAALLGNVHSAVVPTPTNLPRCKALVAAADWSVTRNDCGPTDTICLSEYWTYELALTAGQSCFIGPEDFGHFQFALQTSKCANSAITATYTVASFPSGKDQSMINYDPLNNLASCSPPSAANQSDIPIQTDAWVDLTSYCDAVVSVSAPSTGGACLGFSVYGNAHASYLQALTLAVLSVMAYAVYV